MVKPLFSKLVLSLGSLRDAISAFRLRHSAKWSVAQRSALVLLPIMFLIGDYICFPALVENRMLTENVGITSIVKNQVVHLGTIKAHDVTVAIDKVDNDNYLNYVKGDSNALVIPLYVYEGSDESTIGTLGQAVLAKLMQVSLDDARELRDLFDQINGRSPGDVLELVLHIPQEQYARFPIKHLFVLLIGHGESRKNDGLISKGISDILLRAEEKNVSSLILPCLGYNWADKNSISFEGCFAPVFKSLPSGSAPSDIYLSLYTDWPTFVLERASVSLSRVWKSSYQQANYGSTSLPYRGNLRLTLILLSMSLFVCSFAAPLTIKNFLIIAVGYIGFAVGSGSIVDSFTQGHDASVQFVARALVLVILALGFRHFVRWDPKEIFSKGGGR